MWLPNGKASSLGRKNGRNGLVAVAIDKDKASQHAIKWATENLLSKGQTVILIHVIQKSSASSCTCCRVFMSCRVAWPHAMHACMQPRVVGIEDETLEEMFGRF